MSHFTVNKSILLGVPKPGCLQFLHGSALLRICVCQKVAQFFAQTLARLIKNSRHNFALVNVCYKSFAVELLSAKLGPHPQCTKSIFFSCCLLRSGFC